MASHPISQWCVQGVTEAVNAVMYICSLVSIGLDISCFFSCFVSVKWV
jgi:hypothetical protein